MSEDAPHFKRRIVRWGKFAVQIAILVVVLWATWWTASQAFIDLAARGVSLRQLHPGWLIASGLLYLAGMLPSAFFWHRVMLAMRQRPSLKQSLLAFFISQPGKYVPGKFMVVLLRTTMIRGSNVDVTLAVASIFIETLTMMSVGAVVGAITLGFTFAGNGWLLLFAVCAAIGVGAPAFPPIFRRLVKLTKLRRLHPEIDQSLADLHVPRLAPGWLLLVFGWYSMGWSVWATLQAIPPIPGAAAPQNVVVEVALLTAAVALSIVAGFVSGLPGGLGVRELVVMALVKPHFGATAAVLSAIVHRCVMIVAELAAASLCLVMRSVDKSSTHDGALIADQESSDALAPMAPRSIPAAPEKEP